MFKEDSLDHVQEMDERSRKKSTNNAEGVILKEKEKVSNFVEAQNLLNRNFENYNKLVGNFINRIGRFSERDLRKRFGELRGLKLEIVKALIPVVEKINTISEYEREQLIFQIRLFTAMHSCFVQERPELRGFVKAGRGEGKGAISSVRSDNLNRKVQAESQQFIAQAIIQNPNEYGEMFGRYRDIAQDVYKLEPRGEEATDFDGIKRGIYGLVGAYHHYRSQGYRVLFPHPNIDVAQETDLILINPDIDPESEKQLIDLNIRDINELGDIPQELRKHITIAQVKCRERMDKPQEEYLYNYQEDKNRFYRGPEDEIGEELERGDYTEDHKEFFNTQARGLGYDARFIALSQAEAERKIGERKTTE